MSRHTPPHHRIIAGAVLLAATLALYAIATRGGSTSVATMLLAGVALAAQIGQDYRFTE